ncbi:MAG: hypothetical protein AAF959_06890 [Cyanobacteria bacterium P01_D01_bin.56]
MLEKIAQSSLAKAIFPMVTLAIGIVSLQVSHLQHTKNRVSNNENFASAWDENNAAQRLAMLSALPKFGYKNIFANWTFLNFLQYFGNSELRSIVGYGLSDNYFESIIDNDPYFISSYIFLVNSISMYAGKPEQSIDLLNKGLASLKPNVPSRSYFIWRHKGTDELLFIGDNKAAQNSYQTAAVWAEKSSDKDADLVAKISRKTAQFLATDPNSKPAQIGAWSEILLRATDNTIRQKAIANIEALGGSVLHSQNGQVTVRYKTNVL